MDWSDPANVWGTIHGGLLFAIYLKMCFPEKPK